MDLADFQTLKSDHHGSDREVAREAETLSHKDEAWHSTWRRQSFASIGVEKGFVLFNFKRHVSHHHVFPLQSEDSQGAILSVSGESEVFLLSVGDRVASPSTQWLVKNEPVGTTHRRKAVQMLRDIETYVDENDRNPPEELVESVRLLLDRLYKKVDLPVDVDGTTDGDILVTVYNEKFDALMMHCNVNGTVLCMSNLPGKQEGEQFDTISCVLDSEFFLDALDILYSEAEKDF